MKHTPEPWVIANESYCPSTHRDGIRLESLTAGGIVCDIIHTGHFAADNPEANAQRIVECVNSMAGIASPANAIAAAREALEELLAEADAYARLMPRHEPGSPSAKAERAIALLKGVQP